MKELLEKEYGDILYEPAFTDDGVNDTFMTPGAAVQNAAERDVNLVFAGTGARVESEGNDRKTMKLTPAQERTILDTASANPNTVVVLFAGAPVDMSAWLDKVAAVVWAGFPGERGGEAIANILTGKVCPSGKLSETFPKAYDVTPTATEYRDSQVTRYQEGLDVGYRYYDRHPEAVQFPFGYGLSYTKFSYGGLNARTDGKRVTIRFEIKNEGTRAGKEVAQVYIRPCMPMVYRPVKELKGFVKAEVKAGESKGRKSFSKSPHSPTGHRRKTVGRLMTASMKFSSVRRRKTYDWQENSRSKTERLLSYKENGTDYFRQSSRSDPERGYRAHRTRGKGRLLRQRHVLHTKLNFIFKEDYDLL